MLETHSRIVAELDAELEREHGLPLSSYEVLMYLADAEGGRLRMGELADRLLLSRSGITRLADRLARQGLIARERCDDDGRGYFALLTPTGREKLEAARPTTSRRPPPLPRPARRRRDRRPRRDLGAPARPRRQAGLDEAA